MHILRLANRTNHPSHNVPRDSGSLNHNHRPMPNPSWPSGQLTLPSFPLQGNAYAPTGQQEYPRDLQAPRMLPLPSTMDPSRLLHRPVSVLAIRAESVSESDIEMDNGDESDHGRDCGFEDENDDVAGWAGHPDTIGLGHPQFHETKSTGQLYDAAGSLVLEKIRASFVLKKRTARQRNCWILYRRNYYGIQGSYDLHPSSDASTEETLWLHGDGHEPKPVVALHMRMRGAVDSETGPVIPIVVFNAKRKPLHPGDNPPPAPDRQRMKPTREGSTKLYVTSTGDRADNINIPMNHTWPRNQFRAATQNNGSRRTEQQFYHVIVELMAEVIIDGISESFVVASVMSEPLVVRGRCPLSFKPKDSKPEDGHTRDPNRKGRKPPRDGGGNRKKGTSTTQIPKEGQAQGVSRGSYNKTGGGSRRSTRASSHLPSLVYGTSPESPGPTSQATGTVNRETIPRLDHKLLTLERECWEKERRWEINEFDSARVNADLSVYGLTSDNHGNV